MGAVTKAIHKTSPVIATIAADRYDTSGPLMDKVNKEVQT